jgi:hypothetical protein
MNRFRVSQTHKDLFHNSPVVTAVAFTVTGIALPLIYLIIFHAPPTLGKVLNEFGYQQIVPPSKLYGPGTFNSVELLSDKTVKLHPTCRMDPGMLEGLWEESPTVDREMTAHFSHNLDVSSDFLDSLKSKVSGKQIKDVHLSLRNMRILVLTQEDLLKLRDQYLKDSCEEAIIHNVRNGACVRQSKEVLQADLVYTVRFKDDVNRTQHISAAPQEGEHILGLSGEADTDNLVSGKKLFFGVKLSPGCFTIDESTLALNGT